MDFKEKVQKTVNQGLEASKDLFGRAKEKAKDLSDIGVLKYEISQLRKQEEHSYEFLGKEVYSVLIEGGHSTVSQKTPAIKKFLEDLEDIKRRIAAKEELLRKYDKNVTKT